ncbi:uncharacterized protein [Euwallacea fornicatus]|uniref:uncharacterized protein n=1 Tax=Euwallacea fornicatus TaxID=995702 RepID=UPI00338EA841
MTITIILTCKEQGRIKPMRHKTRCDTPITQSDPTVHPQRSNFTCNLHDKSPVVSRSSAMTKPVLSILILIKILAFFSLRAYCDRKVWVHTSDIYLPTNWVNGTRQTQCNGLVFGKQQDVDFVLSIYRLKSLTFPSYGTLIIGRSVFFDENSTDFENCIALKSILRKPWFDPEGWQNLDDPDNPAVPFVDRIPSEYDDIILKNNEYANMLLLTQDVSVRSVTYHGVSISAFMASNDEFFRIKSSGRSCTDVTGCESSQSDIYYYDICQVNKYSFQPVECEDPIQLMGFCSHPRCGAEIVIGTLKSGFWLDRIKRSLQGLVSRTHAMKIGGNRVQIVFAETNFRGQSLIEATKFYYTLLRDESFFAGDLTLRLSGPPLGSRMEQAKGALSIVFGTLAAVALVLGLLFVSYSSQAGNFTFRNRFLGSRPLSTYILGYNNMEDRSYIVDTRSAPDLTSAFENPMYHQEGSSKTTSNETLTSLKLEEKSDETENRTETPVLEAEDGAETVVLREL